MKIAITTLFAIILACATIVDGRKLKTGGRGMTKKSYDKKSKKGSSSSKKGGSSSAPLGIVFIEDGSGDYLEGFATEIGERIIWSSHNLTNRNGGFMGTSTGHCVTTAGLPEIRYFCNYLVFLTEGEYEGSTLAFQGDYPGFGPEAFGINVITGGTGFFKGASGLIVTKMPESIAVPPIYTHNVMLE
jgi:hypothetical protein